MGLDSIGEESAEHVRAQARYLEGAKRALVAQQEGGGSGRAQQGSNWTMVHG